MRVSSLNLSPKRVRNTKHYKHIPFAERVAFASVTFIACSVWGAATAQNPDAVYRGIFLYSGILCGLVKAPFNLLGLGLIGVHTCYNMQCIFQPKLTNNQKIEAKTTTYAAASPKN